MQSTSNNAESFFEGKGPTPFEFGFSPFLIDLFGPFFGRWFSLACRATDHRGFGPSGGVRPHGMAVWWWHIIAWLVIALAPSAALGSTLPQLIWATNHAYRPRLRAIYAVTIIKVSPTKLLTQRLGC